VREIDLSLNNSPRLKRGRGWIVGWRVDNDDGERTEKNNTLVRFYRRVRSTLYLDSGKLFERFYRGLFE